MPQRLFRSHHTSFVPLLATVIGLLMGLALHQMSGAASAAADDPLAGVSAPLVPHTVTPRAPETTASHAVAAAQQPATAAPAPAPAPAAAAHPPPAPTSRAFAGLTGLTLQLPYGVRAIGFHESGDGRAKALHPMGIPRVNDNLPRLGRAPVGNGFEYLVLRTRGRYNAPTSAVDLSIPFNTPVTSPVTGTVVDANSYLLYREVPDNAVHIVPDARPDLVVVLMHLNGLKVHVGDRVTANQTVIALTGRLLPFASQIDRYAGRRPHVHLEVRRR